MLANIRSPKVKALMPHKSMGGDLIIPVIGVPFGGPFMGGKDFHGEFFDETTEIGPLKIAISYFDHGSQWEDDEVLARAFTNVIIGEAHHRGTAEEGHIYDIILDRHNQYKEVIYQMALDGLLDASSGVKVRESNPQVEGHVKKWHVVEVSLTPWAANPFASTRFKSLDNFKSIVENLMKTKSTGNQKPVAQKKSTPTPPPEPVDEVEEIEDEEVEEVEEASATPVTDTLRSILGDVEQAIDEGVDVTPEQLSTLVGEVKSILPRFDKLDDEIASIKDMIHDTQEALPVIAEFIAKAIGAQVVEEGRKSRPEISAELALKARQNGAPVSNQSTTNNRSPKSRLNGKPRAGKLPPTAPGMS